MPSKTQQVSFSLSLNGSPIPMQAYSYTRNADELNGSWSITLPEPREISSTDLFTLERSASGGNQTLFSNQYPDSIREEDGKQWTRRISGKIEGATFDYEVAPTLDIYFYNAAWLTKAVPTGWTIKDGAIYHQSTDPSFPAQRVYGSGFPHKSLPDGSFLCVATYRTHHGVANYLAQELGITLFTNTPDIEIQRVMKVPANQSYWNAIKNIFSLWNPHYQVIPDGDSIRLEVLDVFNEENPEQVSGRINITNTVIESVSASIQEQREQKIIDHVIIKGAKGVSTTIDMREHQGGSLGEVRLTASSLPEDHKITVVKDASNVRQRKVMGEYTGNVGEKNNERELKQVDKVEHNRYYHEDPSDPANWILVRSESIFYADDGTKLSRKETRHKFSSEAQGFKPVFSQEKLYTLYNRPGTTRAIFDLVRVKTSDQTNVITSLNLALSTEMIEEKVLFEVKEDKDNPEIKYRPFYTPLVEAIQNNLIQPSSKTKQEIEEMTTWTATMSVSRETEGILVQEREEYNRLTGAIEADSQIISDPMNSSSAPSAKEENQYHKEFYSGSGPYRPAVIIEHPDIADDVLATNIANRAFARSGTEKRDLDVRLNVIIPLQTTALWCGLPDLSVQVATTGGYSPLNISRGTYILVGTTERGSASNDGKLNVSQTLKLRNVL